MEHFPHCLQFSTRWVIFTVQVFILQAIGHKQQNPFGRRPFLHCAKTHSLLTATKACWTCSRFKPTNFPTTMRTGSRPLMVMLRNFLEKGTSRPRKVTITRSPPLQMTPNPKTTVTTP